MILLTGASLIEWRLRIPRPNSLQIWVMGAMVILICIEIQYFGHLKKGPTLEKQNDYGILSSKVTNLDRTFD